MTTTDFDYDAFLDGIESVSTLSNPATSPSITENDSDSGISQTLSMKTGFDNTVIDLDGLDFLPPGMESPLSDDPNDDFNLFSSALFDENNVSKPGENSTFEALFSDIASFEQQHSELSQEIPSPPQMPIIYTKPSEIPSINNCVKLQSCANAALVGPKCIKLEPINPTAGPSITIIKTSQPITVAKVPVVTVPITAAPSTKRRRDDSPVNYQEHTNENSTLSLDQLKRQYGNMSEEALKKHLRMIKNRESASLSRKRRKELMENLDSKVKTLTDENEQLKRENSKLLTRIETLEMENELLRRYAHPNGSSSHPKKPLILMGIVLLVVFNAFAIKSFVPTSNDPSNAFALYNNERSVIPSRTLLQHKNENSHELDYGTNMPDYPFIQCVAFINKTHSQRINQDLRSWVQDTAAKQQDNTPMIIPDHKSLAISSDPPVSDSSVIPIQPRSRKVARQTKFQTDNKNQLQPYKNFEANFDDFIHTIDRKNDTLYFVSFKRDHLIFPATEQNQTQRPKMSLILPASMANLNKSIQVPTNHVPMIKIDCEVEDTKLVFVKRSNIPLSYRNELFEYYSSVSQSSM